jgi:transposase
VWGVSDLRDQRIAELERLLSAALERITTLETEVADLRSRLGRNSRNSSQPPSADGPGTSRPSKEPTGRKPGGQPGHKGTKRELVPPEKVNAIVPVEADACGKCGGTVVAKSGAPEAYRHQVIELPQLQAHVTEYRLGFGYCRCCGEWTRAALPPGVPESNFGPRLTAFIALCTGKFRLAKRGVQEMVGDVLGVDIALGSVSNMEQTVSDALAAPVDEAGAYVPAQPTAHLDETGWWEKNARSWLWVATTSAVAVFLVVRSRGKAIAQQLLKGFKGTLVSDRWCGYNWMHVLRRQICWAHLIREFEGFIEQGGRAKRLGELLLAEAKMMFEWWHNARDGTIKRETFRKKMKPLMAEVERLLAVGAVCPNQKVAGTCGEILKLADAMWTFVYTPGVEPTNNLAERDLRHAVIWRRTSFGTQSEAGSRFVERILTTVITLRKQNRNVLEYLASACQAHLRGERPASLLPA